MVDMTLATPTDEATQPVVPGPPAIGGSESPSDASSSPGALPQGDTVPRETTAPAGADALSGLDPAVPAAPSTPEPVARDPWGFRVDGQRITPAGAYRTPDGVIHLPEEVWDREIRPNYLGDRAAHQRTVARLEQQLRALQDDNRPEIVRAKTFTERLLSILELDPEDRDAELDKLHREIPILSAQAEAEAARRQAAALAEQIQSVQSQEFEQATVPLLQEGLSEYVRSALRHEALKDAGLDAKELEEELWSFGLQRLFEDAPEGQRGHLSTSRGDVNLRTQDIDAYLIRQADRARRIRSSADEAARAAREEAQRAKDAAEAAKRNAGAIRGEGAGVPVVTGAGGLAETGSAVQPWHDMTKPYDERRRLWIEHCQRNGIPF